MRGINVIIIIIIYYRWLLGELGRGGERRGRIVKNVKEKNGRKSGGR